MYDMDVLLPTDPETTSATVQSFGGEIAVQVVKCWFVNGKPERIWSTEGHKFKIDEEPFVVTFS